MDSANVFSVFVCWSMLSSALGNPLCTPENFDKVGRVVFGEAANQIYDGQLAVAYTVVNRVEHSGYPNTVTAVLDAKYNHNGKMIHEYETLSRQDHTRNWNREKKRNSAIYQRIINAAKGALCKTQKDPTKCAVAFCFPAGCAAIQDNPWWRVYNIKKIDDHWFGCKAPK